MYTPFNPYACIISLDSWKEKPHLFAISLVTFFLSLFVVIHILR